MSRRFGKKSALAASAALIASLLLGIGLWVQARHAALVPHHRYAIAPGSLKGWKAYGGNWEILNGSIHNNSAERGAKLVTGSSRWTNYTLQADLRFDGNHGDMGVIVRANGEEEGVDAYRGYYAGLRTTDGTLVIGRADYGWLEAQPRLMPGGVSDNTWYRLTVTSYQCWIAAEAQNLTTLEKAWGVLEEHPCVRSGKIGLRSLATGGRWRNISVTPATFADYQRIREHVAHTIQPEFPKREADYNRLLSSIQSTGPQDRAPARPPSPPPANTQIGELLDLPQSRQSDVVVRGVVTLTNPALYIQDPTGGVLVKSQAPHGLNVGDVVEVRGRAKPGLYSALINSNSIRLLWNGTPVPPISVTAAQAVSGAYDARFVEIEGRLISDEIAGEGSQELTLTDGTQTFRTISVHRQDEMPRKIEVNSYLRVRGICVLGQTYTKDLTPFVVLVPSGDDIQVLADPPWWNPLHESMLFAGVLIVVLLIQIAYFRFQRWKADTIIRERERLAHDIHDTMAQGFAGVGYQIQGIHKIVASGDSVDRKLVSEQLRLAYQLVRRCHEEASRTIAVLSPASPPLQDNLLNTLADAARRISGEQIRTVTRIEGTPLPLPLRTADALLHIGREAVVNAAAHAMPAEIAITLQYGERYVELTVVDNGLGFDYTADNAGFGILGMQKRARDIKGSLEIRSLSGRGTTVRICANLQSHSTFHRLRRAFRERMFGLAAH